MTFFNTKTLRRAIFTVGMGIYGTFTFATIAAGIRNVNTLDSWTLVAGSFFNFTFFTTRTHASRRLSWTYKTRLRFTRDSGAFITASWLDFTFKILLTFDGITGNWRASQTNRQRFTFRNGTRIKSSMMMVTTVVMTKVSMMLVVMRGRFNDTFFFTSTGRITNGFGTILTFISRTLVVAIILLSSLNTSLILIALLARFKRTWTH